MRAFTLTLAAGLVSLAAAGPALAAPMQISGTVENDDTLMTGDLRGPIETVIDDAVLNDRTGGLWATGTEHFTGCLADGVTCGEIDFAFGVSGRFLANGSLRARCLHKIVGGTGDFAGAEGLITMRERERVTWRGHIEL